MKISCCIIGKNEVDDISNCLDSVIDKVYEVIYVDTGSTDGTLELVKKNYPKVKTFFYKWNDDFSAARNFGIKKAKGDFIFYLDCDEKFVGEFPSSLGVGSYNFDVHNLNDNGSYVVSVCSRLISNVKGLQFKGKIHEIFDINNLKIPLFKFNTGHIVHYGYKNSYREKKNKSERNMNALLIEFEKSPNSQNIFYLSQEYFIKKEYQESERLCVLGIDKIDETSAIDMTFKPLLYQLYLSNLVEQNKDEEILMFEDVMLKDSNNPECNVLLMKYYIEKDVEEKVLLHAFQTLKHVNAQHLPVKFIDKNIRYAPYTSLAHYYMKQKEDKLACLYFLELAYGSGLDDIRVLADIYNLLPKCERNIMKWEFYNNILYEKTGDKKLLKDMIGCYLASNDNDKKIKAIEIANELSNVEEKEQIKNHLGKIGRGDLVTYLK